MQRLLWTARSLCNFVRDLAKKGPKVCRTVVGKLRRGMGYNLSWYGLQSAGQRQDPKRQ
jgi:hypothetical protein